MDRDNEMCRVVDNIFSNKQSNHDKLNYFETNENLMIDITHWKNANWSSDEAATELGRGFLG